jgi:hypothetical protein
MRARQRHFKPKSVAATAAFDSRYISGLSDGNAVSTWSDISGNATDATQSTANSQPIYKTETLGGSPSVRFDGSDDHLLHSITNATTCSIVVVLSRLSSQSSYRGLCAFGDSNSSGTVMLLRMNSPTEWGTYTGVNAISNTTIATSSPTIMTTIDNAASGGSFFLKGVADGTWTSNSVGQLQKHIGGLYLPGLSAFQGSNVDMGAVYLMSVAMTDSVRKRIERGLGYSFKIACS